MEIFLIDQDICFVEQRKIQSQSTGANILADPSYKSWRRLYGSSFCGIDGGGEVCDGVDGTSGVGVRDLRFVLQSGGTRDTRDCHLRDPTETIRGR